MSSSSEQQKVANYHKDVDKRLEKYQALRDLDVFVLDNSMRESTVGQLRGHTLESKWQIYDEVKKCGFKNTIVASFSHMTRVDDVFIKQLTERGEDRRGLWAFSEITEGTLTVSGSPKAKKCKTTSSGAKGKVPDTESVPVGIRKLCEVGLYNVIFEVDLSDGVYDFELFPMPKMLKLIKKWMVWCHENLHPKAKIMFNIRDLAETMPDHPERVFQTVAYLANLPGDLRPFGMMFEEPSGKTLPEECGAWAKYIRQTMDENKWKGHLLVHVHEKFGYCDATALQVLMDGADGIWASVCAEGAAMGHASTCVTLLNLIRLGNKKVLEKYNCTYLRKAAINVTKITSGSAPNGRQPVYGPRATDFVFGLNPEEFDLASFFGEKAPVRITTMASKEMIQQRLVRLFGNDPQFTLDLTSKMKALILEDLRSGRKEEYMSKVGLALLLDRAGGKVTEPMRDAIDNVQLRGPNANNLIKEIRKMWDEWDVKDKVQGDDLLQYDNFYNGFMAPYFSCYRCSDTRRALQAVDMDADGQVDWNEFLVYLKWALHEYPDIADTEQLLDIAFRKGLIPAMRDELLYKK